MHDRKKAQAAPMTDEWPPSRARRATKRWCRGVHGREHVWLKAEMRWGPVYHCIHCGKQNYGSKTPSIASQIRRLRQAKGLTQEALADLLGVKQPRIADIENVKTYRENNYSVALLERVAFALGKRLVITFEDRD